MNRRLPIRPQRLGSSPEPCASAMYTRNNRLITGSVLFVILLLASLSENGLQAAPLGDDPNPPPSSPVETTQPTANPITDTGGPSCGGGDTGGSCETDATTPPAGNQVDATGGNPINLMSGNKHQSETDFHVPGAMLTIRRMYNSGDSDSNRGLGQGWSHTFAVSLHDRGNGVREIIGGDGARIRFTADGADENGHPIFRAHQPHHGYLSYRNERHYWHLSDGRTLKFTGAYLVNINWPDQRELTLFYRARRLHSVTDETGRVLRFDYYQGRAETLPTFEQIRHGAADGYLESVTLPDGSVIGYDYDSQRNLTRVRYPDETTREYHYENATFPNHLTGLTDRTGVRFASWTYDEYGRGISSEHAGGVERVTLAYPHPNEIASGGVVHTIVTNSLGYESQYKWQQVSTDSRPRLLSSSGAGCTTCPVTGMVYTYDEKGRLLSSTRNGQGSSVGLGSVIYRYDGSDRLVETRRIDAAGVSHLIERREFEGASLLASKIYTPSVNPGGERLSEIERNAQGLPVRITQHGWAPWVALPGESEYSTDENTASIFRPMVRSTTFRYEDDQLVAIDGPRTDVDDITQLTWDDRHRLIAIARPAGAAMHILNFDALGRAVELRRGPASGFQISYDQRSNITAINYRGLISTYEYDAEGRTRRFTDAFGRTTRIIRDEAGRSTEVEDSFGRRRQTDWDSETRATTQSYFGIDGSLIRSIQQSFREDGHRESHTEQTINPHGERSLNSFSYVLDDNNTLAGINHTQSGLTVDVDFDEFLRTISVSAEPGLTTTAYLDRLGNEAGQTDYRGNTTRHIRDDFGQRVGILSQDTGVERLERNSAGQVVKRVREDSGTTDYTYDAAGRILTRTHQDGAVTRYEYSADTWLLTSISNQASTEEFAYNDEGDMLVHSRTIGPQKFETRYRHNASGRLLEKDLPDGQTLVYEYHTSGTNIGSLKSIDLKSWFGLQNMLVGDIDVERRDGDLGWQSHNGLQTRIDLSSGGQVLSVETPGIQSVEYQYNKDQKVAGIENGGTLSKYEYRRGYLVAAESGSASHHYEYDSLGNRRAQYVRDITTNTLSGTEYQYTGNGGGNRLIQSRDMVSGLMRQWTYTKGGGRQATRVGFVIAMMPSVVPWRYIVGRN